ncbi:DUF4225 domain-containing protein [Pseudomonas sichuanensis]|uniref:DUF4225 domain-containing protein n=1 Tax=Pseudomonas sichuanensis TaxID=2213015 RepID=UPI002ABD014B|nr:DUF4225 domain-containing protein [Pseudomonas sichuanensis]MDZ4017330.1 hypothetical protein [Pseudomonas sichuanensis]
MSQRDEENGERLDEAYWEVNAAASRLISYGCGVSAKHLRDRRLRMQFNRELAYYARRVLDDVYHRKSSAEDALIELRNERDRLKAQSERISMQAIGVVGGTGQVITGAGICYGSLGLLCATLGAPMIAHGGNNLYESARGLYEGRDDIEGPVKKGYREASKILGYTEREGTLAYLASDAALSVGALFRPVLKADAWRLYKYYSVDKEAAIRQMSTAAGVVETATTGATAYQFNKEYKK